MASRPRATAIVGGGASGVLAAIHLQRRFPSERLVVVEPRHDLGRGIAYGTNNLDHLLNVRAGHLSAYADDPTHFTRWVSGRMSVDGSSFLPRTWYGHYLNSLLGPVEHVRARAVDVTPSDGGVRIALSDRTALEARRVILALGANPPAWPSPFGGVAPRWVLDPWRPGALAPGPESPVLVLGTGLTAVDVALSLRASGHRVIAASRHGLLPRAHPQVPPEPIRCPPPDRPTARSLLGWARAAALESGSWAPVVDSLRSSTNSLWEQMSGSERVRLLRHVHRRWEVLLHRMAPEIASRILEMRESGQLEILAGGLTSVRVTLTGLEVEIRDSRLEVSCVVNCAGPTSDVTRSSHPLVRRLLQRGVARPSWFNLGIQTDSSGCLPRTDGTIWLVGPLRRGPVWETTAIPEIREQAADLASSLEHLPELACA